MDFSLAIEVTYPGSDYIAICQLAFEWADSYDKKVGVNFPLKRHIH